MDCCLVEHLTIGDRISLGSEMLAEDDPYPPRTISAVHGADMRLYGDEHRVGGLGFVLERLRDVMGKDPRPWGWI